MSNKPPLSPTEPGPDGPVGSADGPVGPSGAVAGLFLRSSGAAALSQGLRMISVLGAQLLLRRWIPAEDWGLFQWAMVLFLILGAVRDLGVAYHVLRIEPRPWANLLALELLWGGLLMLLAMAAAPLGPLLYRAGIETGGHPDTAGVLRCLALFLFFEGLATLPKIFLEGELRVGRAVAPELWRNVVFVGLACFLAYSGQGVWSLVIGHTVGAGVYAASLWWRVRGEIPWVWHGDQDGDSAHRGRLGAMAELLKDSLPLSAIWFLAILIRHIDPLILGLRFPFVDVGNYTFAYEWATLASGLILLPAITRVLYPALLQFRADMDSMFRAFALSSVFMLAFEVPAALVLLLNADLVVQLVGGTQWDDAHTYLRLLCLVPLVDPFSRLGGEVMKALHRDRLWLVASLSTVLTLAIGGYWLTGRMGPIGMAWINLLSPGGFILAWGLYRINPEGFRRLLGHLGWTYLIPIPLFLAAWLAAGRGSVVGDPDPLRLILCLVAGGLSILITARRFGADFLSFFRPT